MKHINKILLLFAFVLSAWQAKAQAPPIPTVYENVGSGNHTINDTIRSGEKWFKWTGDSVVAITCKLLQNGSSYSVDSLQLYLSNGTNLTLRSRDSLRAYDSSAFMYTGIVPPGSTFFLRIVTSASSCTSCAMAAPVLKITFNTNYGTCAPVTACDLINNGSFESTNPSNPCNYYVNGVLDCWTQYEGTTDVYKRYCTNNNNIDNLGSSTWSTPPFNSHNGSPNNVIVGCYSFYEPGYNYKESESIQTLMNSSLIIGQVYKLSFWAFNVQGPYDNHNMNLGGNPCYVTVATWNTTTVSPGGNFNNCDYPNSVHPIANFNITALNTWTNCVTTFTYSGPSNQYNFMIGPDIGQMATLGYQGDSDPFQYVLFDDISLTRVYTPTLTPVASPNGICAGQSTTLTASSSYTFASSSYTWMPGAMTGSNVVVSPSVSTVYTVTGTDNCGMVSAPYTVSVSVVPNPTITASASPTITCPGTAITLSAGGGLSTSYHWQPGGQTGASITATVTAPTVYTVTGQNSYGCYGTSTVSANVYTTSISTSPSSTICVGATVNLTASTNIPGTTFNVWQPGGLSGTTISVTPSVTTVYTVTTSNLLGDCISTRTATITVNSFSTLSASPSTICAGNSATLSASGATSYTWNPGGYTSPSIVVSPSVTTTYTLSGNIPSCGLAHDMVTVTVLTSTYINSVATVTASVPYVCSGNSTTLTVNIPSPASYSYQWYMNSSLISGATAQSYTTIPTDNGVYTCYITDNTCGQTGNASTCVDIVAFECCTYAETLTNVTINSAPWNSVTSYTYNLAGTITIAANTTWTGSHFRMSSGSKIVVNPGVRLTLDNCNLFSCQDMWEGIEIAHNGTSSGQISVINGSTIEDAYKGIHNDCLGTTAGGTITVTGGSFNKNYEGIEISNSQAATGTYSFHPLSVSQATFTSAASTTSPGNSLKCSSYYSPTIASRGYAGIATYTVHGIVVSSGSPPTVPDNYFSKMDYGIYSSESDLLSLNSKFKTFTYTNITSFPPPPNRGVAIYGINASPTNTNTIKVDVNNVFQDVWRAVQTQNTANTRVLTYTITNSAISGSACASGCIGNTGIYAGDATAYFQANYGSITNCQNGVSAFYSSIPSYTTNPSAVSASNNTIAATGTNVATGAISISSAGNNFTGMAANSIVSVGNSISSTANGIYYNNIKNGGRISNNTISITYASTGNRTGIRLNGTQNCTVDNNTVTCTSTSNSTLRGIWTQLSAGGHINCNTVNTVGQSFVFEGNCLSTPKGFYNNILNNANDGLVLQSSAVIGKQGSSTTGAFVSSGNQWTGTFGNSKTATDGATSSSTTSILVIKNNTNEYPSPQSLNITYGSGVPNRDNYGTSSTNSPASLILTAYSGYACSTPLTSGLKVAQDTTGEALTKALQDSALFNLTVNTDSSDAGAAQALEINRKYVYDLMAQGYTTSHAGLNAFFASYDHSAIDNYSQVDSLLQTQNYTAAESVNNGAAPTSAIEQNQQQINDLLLSRLQDPGYLYSQSEIDILNSLSTSCPLTDGNAVYQARALLCLIYSQDLAFTDNCSQTNEQSKLAGIKFEMPESFNLFPNPNSGSMTLAYHVNRKAELRIFDVNGREILQQSLDRGNTQAYIHANLAQGIYYYTIAAEDGQVIKTDKLIIIK